MQRLRAYLWFFCWAYLTLSSNSLAQSDTTVEKIRVVTPVFEGLSNADGTGFYFDVLRLIYAPLNIEVTYHIVPFNRATHMLKNKEADMMLSIYSQTLIRQMAKVDYILTPQYPLSVEHLTALYPQNIQWQGEQSLEHKRVAWIRGYSYQYFLSVPVRATEISSSAQILPLFDSHRIDFYIDSHDEIEKIFSRQPHLKQKYQTSIITSHNLYVGFSNTDKSQQFIKLFDERMKQLVGGEALEAIYQRWHVDKPIDDSQH